jgi:hypothetical protein
LIGMLVTHVLVHGRLQSVDRGVEVWFAARRTGVWNSITMFGADMAETQTSSVAGSMALPGSPADRPQILICTACMVLLSAPGGRELLLRRASRPTSRPSTQGSRQPDTEHYSAPQ